MYRPSRSLAVAVAAAIMMNSLAFAGQTVSGVQALSNEVKAMRAQIDTGVSASDAIDTFAKALADQNISVQDVDQYVKDRLTVREYQAFNAAMSKALKGIKAENVKPEELGELVGQALSQVGSEGLSWSSCASTWSGVGVVVASIVVGIFAIIKSKSESSITKDYNEKIEDSNATYNSLIDRSNNWQTRIPQDMNDLNAQIQYDYQQLYYYQQQYYYAQTQEQQQMYANYIRDYQDRIYYANQSLLQLNALYTSYTADPSLAIADAVLYTSQRDQAFADLSAQLAQALADAPANQRLGRNLGIGAGVGAAAGTFLLVRGIRDGACSR